MQQEGPQLEVLTRRLAECPPEFLEPPRRGNAGTIDVAAIVCDHLRAMGVSVSAEGDGKRVEAIRAADADHQRLMAIAAWLLHDPWFLARPALGPTLWRLLLADELKELSRTIRPELTITDPDRREELVRLCLRGLELRPRGETVAQAADRLATLDSVERDRVVRETRAAEARARQIREEMARRAAQEAAARYAPE